MTDRFSQLFKDALAGYVSYWLEHLELVGWRIQLQTDPPDSSGAAASMRCVYGRRVGELCLASDFFEYKPDLQRHYLVHELVHVLTDGCDNVIAEGGLDVLLGRPAFAVLSEAWRVQVEYLTDHLAYVVVDLVLGFPRHDRLWANVLRAEQGELPIPDPDTRRKP